MRPGHDHRNRRRGRTTMLVAAGIAAVAIPSALAATSVNGPFGFDPIDDSAAVGSLPEDAPFELPAGFDQDVVTDEKGLFSDGPNFYGDLIGTEEEADWPDMNQLNSTGEKAGRFLYRDP